MCCQGIGNKGNKGGNEKQKKKDEDKFKEEKQVMYVMTN